MSETLSVEKRVPLTVIAGTLGVDRKTVVRWADSGYCGHRLENYRIGKKRYSDWDSVQRFLTAMNGPGACTLLRMLKE